VAALVCHLMRVHTEDNIHDNNDKKNENNLENSKDSKSYCCITYGCPSSVCARLAECMDKYVTCVVLHDDIIRYKYICVYTYIYVYIYIYM
jgi:hypothetical protein